MAVMTYADNRELRHEIHRAFVTRASEQSKQDEAWDNTKIMSEIVGLRHGIYH